MIFTISNALSDFEFDLMKKLMSLAFNSIYFFSSSIPWKMKEPIRRQFVFKSNFIRTDPIDTLYRMKWSYMALDVRRYSAL